MIRDRIVFGINSSKIRKKLINVGAELTLEKAIQIAQLWEYSQSQLRAMGSLSGAAAPQEVGKVKQHRSMQQNEGRARARTTRRQPGTRPENDRCGHCGSTDHRSGAYNCPAKGKQCCACAKMNHFSKMCRSVIKENVHDCENGSNNKCESESDLVKQMGEFYIDTVSHSSLERAFVELNVGPSQTPISFKIDTGSSANILPAEQLRRLNIHSPLEPPDHKLTSYTSNVLPGTGKINLVCKHKNMKINTTFDIVDSSAPPLFKLKDIN